MALTLISSPRFADHVTPPGHPERPERAEVMDVVATRWIAGGGATRAPVEAGDADLRRVHDTAYIASLVEVRGRSTMIDEDTFTSPESETVARLATGAVLAGVEIALAGPRSRALALVRPPGHHAERDRAMGFCFYNSVAVAAAAARAKGLRRVAIVDYDVHHGNGTQWMFYEDATVLFISTHQFPFYPGTGAAEEIGRGEGEGFTLNVPLAAGATDADYDLVFDRLVDPVLRQFAPELLFLSAGFDAHEQDPLASMRMTTAGYRQLTTRVVRTANELCEGRLVAVTEGGYDAHALHDCLAAAVEVLAIEEPSPVTPLTGDTRRADEAIAAVTRAQAGHWRL